jgi:hypothetical protein
MILKECEVMGEAQEKTYTKPQSKLVIALTRHILIYKDTCAERSDRPGAAVELSGPARTSLAYIKDAA